MLPDRTSIFNRDMVEFIRSYPSIWPVLLALLLIPAMALVSRRSAGNGILTVNRDLILTGWGVACTALFVFSDLANFLYPAFHEDYESVGLSIAYSLFNGGQIYTAPDSGQLYTLPYGPAFYATLGLSHWLLGGGVFAAKFPCSLAPLLALGLFWSMARSLGASRSMAWVLVGLEASLLLAIRHASFWTKTDPLLLLVITVGAWVALRRDQRWSPVLGICAGLAMGLKLSAGGYFLPIFVLAFMSGWRFRAFAFCLVSLLGVFLLPFALFPYQISFTNYMSFLQLVAQEGFSMGFGGNYARWVVMFIGLVIVLDRWVGGTVPGNSESRRQGLVYRVALLGGFAVIAVPASVVGAGSNHHIPFIPLVLLACGNLFQPVGALRTWSFPQPLLWRSAACAILLGTGMVAIRNTWWIATLGREQEYSVKAGLTDIRQIIRQYPEYKILMGVGGESIGLPTRLRHELVLAGHPIGLDPAVVSDYQMGGGVEPRMGPLLEELDQRDKRPLLWLVARGGDPFTARNIYNPSLRVFPESFRRDFLERFLHQGQTPFFDLYFNKSTNQPLTMENHRGPDPRIKPPG